MNTFRLRGLVNLLIFATAMLCGGYFLALAVSVRYLPFLRLEPAVNVLLYTVPTLIGVAAGARVWIKIADRIPNVGWQDVAWISTREIAFTALLMFGLIFGTKDVKVSRLFVAFYLVTAWLLLLWVNRYLPYRLAQIAFPRAHRTPTIFVGRSATTGRLRHWVSQKEHLGARIVGILSDEPPGTNAGLGLPLLGRVADLAAVVTNYGIAEVILLDLPQHLHEFTHIVEVCQAAGCRFLVYQNNWDALPIRMSPVVEQEHLFLAVHNEPLEDPFNRTLKRAYDIFLSLPVVLLALPLLSIAVATIQRLQAPGPLVFKRARGGRRGERFWMLKFRSMYANQDSAKLESVQAKADDPRIYPFGHFLRRTSLDEFPQFWNVLAGHMSIVGPRPHLLQHDGEFSAVAKTYRTRQLVKPGITGLAQVEGLRGEISDPALLHRRVELDIYYITHWSIWLDIQITARTLLQVIRPPRSAR